MKKFAISLFCLVAVLPWFARAALTIEITQGIEGAVPIAVVPFGTGGNRYTPPENVSAIIAADLARSGRFAPLPEQNLVARPVDIGEVRFQDWRTLGVENLVIGSIEPAGADQYRVQFRLFDVFRGRQITGYSLPASAEGLRYVAHRISDLIYEALTGQPGAFATRIAYVISESLNGKKTYQLQLADSDGYNPKTLLSSPQPLMSPAWSPDGRKLAYVSFEKHRAAVFIQDIFTGKREEACGLRRHKRGAGLVAGRAQHGGHPVARRQPGDLQHAPQRQDAETADRRTLYRYRTCLVARWSQYRVHLGSWWQSAALPHAGAGRARRAPDFRR